MIPQEKSEAVVRGVREAFGTSGIDDVRMITRGNSGALVYRIEVGGAAYLLRLITRVDDPTLPDHFTCMKAAAESGLAPKVHYTSIEDRISITDFVETASLPDKEALSRMPALLRTLHALAAFPKRADHLNTTCTFLVNNAAVADGFVQSVKSANVFAASATDEVFARFAQVATAYSRVESDLVSSHNDLFKPDNILFDGNRIWLVDWEAAFLNDRYADLAVVANMLVTNEEEEAIYLHEYFGAAPDAYQLARFFLMRQLSHLFYSMAFLLIGSTRQPIDWSKASPKLDEFRPTFWAGEIDLADASRKIEFGRLHLEWLLEDTRSARFNESLKIVADGPVKPIPPPQEKPEGR